MSEDKPINEVLNYAKASYLAVARGPEEILTLQRRIDGLLMAFFREAGRRRKAEVERDALRLQFEAMTAQNLAMRQQAIDMRTEATR